jgi:hypothetical protein
LNIRDEVIGVFISEEDWVENSLSQSEDRDEKRRIRVEKQAVEGRYTKWSAVRTM